MHPEPPLRSPAARPPPARIASAPACLRALATALFAHIQRERSESPRLAEAFDELVATCQKTIHPRLPEQAIEEMLLQHILTEPVFRVAFEDLDLVHQNPVAAAIEKVMSVLVSRAFDRGEILRDLDPFYRAIEKTAATIEDLDEKQHFLHGAYEKILQGLGAKAADTHGIVYTPQPIVRFMVRSVDDILRRELGCAEGLASEGVHVVDPFVGTGNFMLQVMRQIPRSLLTYKYEHELYANEVMLLPYHVASLSIERAYAARTGRHKPFAGLHLADTFEAAAYEHPEPIVVVIGNPPYNAGQEDDNDGNRNKKYSAVDRRIAETYARSSKATLLNALGDPYVKAIRWASDRIGDRGIVAFVTNNSYLDGIPFDGMRKHLGEDFDTIYCLDLGGDVRKNPRISGSTHNVFGVQVGVCIGIFVRNRAPSARSDGARIHHARLDELARKEEKLALLDRSQSISGLTWCEVMPDRRSNWITSDLTAEYDALVPLGIQPRRRAEGEAGSIFRVVSNGPKSNNDPYVYDFSRDVLERRAAAMMDAYGKELRRWQARRTEAREEDVERFLRVDPRVLKWIRSTRRHLLRAHEARFDAARIRRSAYRPYCRRWYLFDACFNEDLYQFPRIFPTPASEVENRVIVATCHSQVPFSCQMVASIPCVDVGGRPSQCFPFYTYDEDGANRRENITDWALDAFRERYGRSGAEIGKWDIFHYVYAVLHHPAYRLDYATNLRRALPRIPYAPDFWAFAGAGKRLAEIHAGYEAQPAYVLEHITPRGAQRSWRVERMRLGKDKDRIVYNDTLTLAGVPPEVFEYRIGTRSALEWVVDQLQVSTDGRSGITRDPNRPDDPAAVVRLVGQVITVSLETVRIVGGLPRCEAPADPS